MLEHSPQILASAENATTTTTTTTTTQHKAGFLGAQTSVLKGLGRTPSHVTSWSESAESVQIFPFAGSVWLFAVTVLVVFSQLPKVDF